MIIASRTSGHVRECFEWTRGPMGAHTGDSQASHQSNQWTKLNGSIWKQSYGSGEAQTNTKYADCQPGLQASPLLEGYKNPPHISVREVGFEFSIVIFKLFFPVLY